MSTLFITGISVSAQPQPSEINQSQNIDQGELTEKTGFNFFNGFLSLTSSQDNLEPGEELQFDASPTLTQDIDNVNDLTKIVEIYRCDDSLCNDPNPFVEADRKQVDVLGGGGAYEGGEWSWSVSYDVPSQDSEYEAVAYLWNSETSQVVSTEPETSFTVNSPDPEPEPDPEPSIELTQTPGFTVDEDSNTVTGSLEISNNGDGDMSSYDIIEMQVRPEGSNPLSFVGSQQVCDESNRNNVNKEYRLDSGDTRDISLQNKGDLSDGESYTVYFLTRSECGGEKVEPIYNSYNAGTFTLEEPQTEPEPEPEQSVEQLSKPQISVTGDTVTGEVSFKNSGGAMPDEDIVEMQVRPKGQTPLAFSSNQEVCDQSNPNNVHRKYDLSGGESDSTSLTVSGVDDGEYTVYFLTREGCAPDNDKVEPYYNSVNAGTVTVSTTGDGDGSSVGLSTTLLLAGGIGVLMFFTGIIVVIGGVLYKWG